MSNLSAAFVIMGVAAATSPPCVAARYIQTHPAMHSSVHLTEKQKQWFGRAVAHILRGDH